MKPISKCKTCGEKILETGNYYFKILKSKRRPKKVVKLLKARGSKLDELTANYSQTKFGRFLLQRSDSKNVVEITCGNCSASSQIKMKKPCQKLNDSNLIELDTQYSQTQHGTISLNETSSKKQRKKKRKKDLTAGLVIPPSLHSSTASSLNISNVHKSEVSVNDSSLTLVSNQSSQRNVKQFNFMSKTELAKRSAQSTATKDKEMENLRKILFKSKNENNKNKGASLKDFLATM